MKQRLPPGDPGRPGGHTTREPSLLRADPATGRPPPGTISLADMSYASRCGEPRAPPSPTRSIFPRRPLPLATTAPAFVRTTPGRSPLPPAAAAPPRYRDVELVTRAQAVHRRPASTIPPPRRRRRLPRDAIHGRSGRRSCVLAQGRRAQRRRFVPGRARLGRSRAITSSSGGDALEAHRRLTRRASTTVRSSSSSRRRRGVTVTGLGTPRWRLECGAAARRAGGAGAVAGSGAGGGPRGRARRRTATTRAVATFRRRRHGQRRGLGAVVRR